MIFNNDQESLINSALYFSPEFVYFQTPPMSLSGGF